MPDFKKLASHFPCHHVLSHHSSRLKQADISFPGFPFDLAFLHAHQSLACSKWRIPHTQDYLRQLTNSPQRMLICFEDLVLNWLISPHSFCPCFLDCAKVNGVKLERSGSVQIQACLWISLHVKEQNDPYYLVLLSWGDWFKHVTVYTVLQL